jgi:hypothetical protein
MKKVSNFNGFKNESVSKPQLKYPVDKCLDFYMFASYLESKGVDLTELPTEEYGTKQIKRNTGNFYELLNTMDPIFPKLSSWKKYDEIQAKKIKAFGIPHTTYRYSEYMGVYELPIKYDSSQDYSNWVEKRINFFDNMKKMKELQGKKWTEEDEKLYSNGVSFGPQNLDWYNIVLDELYKSYPQYYKNGKIKIWHDKDEFSGHKQIWDYPLDKSYFLSDLEKWIDDTFDIDTTGFYEWILDSQYIERRYWERVWEYDIEDETFRKTKANENIMQINEILRQLYKVNSMPIYIDYYKDYHETD